MQDDLTTRQRETLEFIGRHAAAKGFPPSLREIGAHFGVNMNAVYGHVRRLIEKGYLERGPKQASRSLTLPRIALSVLGQIAAGEPLEACQTPEPLDTSRLFADGNRALRVADDSLSDRLVRRGDYVVTDGRGREIGVIRRL